MKFLKYLFSLLNIIAIAVFLYEWYYVSFNWWLFATSCILLFVNFMLYTNFIFSAECFECGCEEVENLMWWNWIVNDGNCDCGDNCDCDL